VSTVLLLNGGSLVDSSGRHTLIANDGTVTSSGGRLSFDGASSLRIDDNLSDFSFPGDFTIEGEFFGTVAGAGTEVFFSNYVGQAGDFELFTRGSPSFAMGIYSTSGVYFEGGPAVVDDTVHAFAFVRQGTTVSYYVDGTRIAQDSSGLQDYTMDTPSSVFIGREGAASKFFKGLLRLRVDNGVALYTGATYTPPTWPIGSGIAPTGMAEIEVDVRAPRRRRIPERNFKPLLQRVLEAKYQRVKPAKERAQRRAKAIEQDAAQLIADEPQNEERFRALMAQWQDERPVLPAVADPRAVFEAQVGFRLRQLELVQQARAALQRERDDEDAIAALLLLS